MSARINCSEIYLKPTADGKSFIMFAHPVCGDKHTIRVYGVIAHGDRECRKNGDTYFIQGKRSIEYI